MGLLFRIPVTPVGPTTYLNDTFTDTNGTLLHAHTADVGGIWISPDPGGADYQIISGAAVTVDGWSYDETYPGYYNNATMPAADYEIGVGFTVVDGPAYAMELYARHDGTNKIRASVIRQAGGTFDVQLSIAPLIGFTQITDGWIAESNGNVDPAAAIGTHTMKLKVQGDICTVYFNNVLVLTGNQNDAITPITLTAAGKVGFGIGGHLGLTNNPVSVNEFTVTSI